MTHITGNTISLSRATKLKRIVKDRHFFQQKAVFIKETFAEKLTKRKRLQNKTHVFMTRETRNWKSVYLK